jgi:CO/xanthine dehydrogenase Mo-binding subunit
VTGTFEYANDLQAAGMLWGATLRSPHPHARILRVDTSAAAALPRRPRRAHRPRRARRRDVRPRRPGRVRARARRRPLRRRAGRRGRAEDPVLARRAAAAVAVEYEPLPAVTDPELALDAPDLHPLGNVFRHVRFTHGDPDARGDVVVEGTYRLGMQDQLFLAPEAGLAVPAEDGGVGAAGRDPVAALRPRPGRALHRPAAGEGAAAAGRRRRRLRRARGRHAQIHACLLAAGHRAGR